MNKFGCFIIEEPKRIPFTEQAIGQWLNDVIWFWSSVQDEENNHVAQFYIDAFQAVHLALFDEKSKGIHPKEWDKE